MLAGAGGAVAVGDVRAGGGGLGDPLGALAAGNPLLAARGVEVGSVGLHDEAVLRELGLGHVPRDDLSRLRDHRRAFRERTCPRHRESAQTARSLINKRIISALWSPG